MRLSWENVGHFFLNGVCALMRGMFKPLSIYIGRRYLRAKRRSHFISFISLSSIFGLALSIAVLITVLSVINGFQRELEQRILGLIPQAKLYSYEPMADWEFTASQLITGEEVQGVAPFNELQGMLSANKLVKPAFVTGIDPAYERDVSILEGFINNGSLDLLTPGAYGIIMDAVTANELGLIVGDKVTLILPEASISPAGLLPRFKRFTLKATFSTGADVGKYMVLIHYQDAARVLRQVGKVHGFRLKVKDLFTAPKVAWRLSHALSGNYYPSDWTRSHGSLYQAIRMQKGMIALLLLLIVAVAVFNIVASLVMLVNDKKADIAILRTLGLSSFGVMRIFIVQGFFIGAIGSVIGALLGLVFSSVLSDLHAGLEALFNLNLLESYFIHYLPTEIRLSDVVGTAMMGLLLTVLASIYPAWRASKTEPADELRHE